MLLRMDEGRDQKTRELLEQFIARRGQGAIKELCTETGLSREMLRKFRLGNRNLGSRGLVLGRFLERQGKESPPLTMAGADVDPQIYEWVATRLDALSSTLRDPNVPRSMKSDSLYNDLRLLATAVGLIEPPNNRLRRHE